MDLKTLRDAVVTGDPLPQRTALGLIDLAIACHTQHDEPVGFKGWRYLFLLAVVSFIAQATAGVMIAKAFGWV